MTSLGDTPTRGNPGEGCANAGCGTLLVLLNIYAFIRLCLWLGTL